MNLQFDTETSTGKNIGRGMIFAAWILLLGLLTFGFQSYLEKRNNPNSNPYSQISDSGVRQVVLQRNPMGHYTAGGEINGRAVVFLVDTGATDVAISKRLADRLALQRGRATRSQTANGRVTTWETILQEVRLGDIRIHQVRASILPNMPTSQVLLGMSFLKHLELVQRGKELTLKQHASNDGLD